MVEFSGLFGFFTPKPVNKVEQLTEQLSAAEANRNNIKKNNETKLAEAEALVAKLTAELETAKAAAAPVTEVKVHTGGARYSKKGRRTVKHKRNKRTK
jgi:hypothetical protein